MGDHDLELAALVRAIPAAHWEQLPGVLARLEADQAPYEWRGGDPCDDGSLTMPWVEYGPAVEAAVDWLRAAGLVTPLADWMSTEGRDDRATTSDDSMAGAARLATTIVRGERFAAGTIASAVDSGVLGALLRRLRRWSDVSSPPDPTPPPGDAATAG